MSISNILKENGENNWNLECATMKIGTGPTVISASGDVQFDNTSTGTSKYNVLASGGASLLSVSNSLSAGQCKIGAQTYSTSTETGALVVMGGVGIGEKLHVGADINVGGNINVTGVISGGSINLHNATYSYPTIGGLVGTLSGTYRVLNDLCFMKINALFETTSGTGETIQVIAGLVPAQYRPANSCYHSVFVFDNDIGAMGTIFISVTGQIVIYVSFGSGFTTTGKCGIGSTTIVYNLT